MNTSNPADSPGYHFEVGFMPEWSRIVPIVVRRARLLGYTVGDDGNEIAPLASSITFAGTRRNDFARGGLRFDVLEHRRDLRANVVQHAGSLGDHSTYHFGLAHPERLGNGVIDESRSQAALGVWLRQGALVLLATEGPEGQSVAEEPLGPLDVWEGLDQLWRFMTGGPTGSNAISDTDVSQDYPPPDWAPDFTMRVRSTPETVQAILRHPNMAVGMRVHSIVTRPSAPGGPEAGARP